MLYDYTTVTADTVRSEIESGLAKADEHVARAIASASAPSFDATLQPLEDAAAEAGTAYGRSGFIGQVHTDSDVRDAGTEAEERLNKWRVALAFREDLYRAVRAFADTDEAKSLTGERARLLEHWLRDFRRAGHELSAEDRAELERLRTRLVELEVAFQRNLNEYQDGIEVTREQLEGLPEEYVARLKPGEREGTYRVSLDYPELNPFLEQAHDRELRRELFTKHWRRAVDINRPLLDEALEIRRKIAGLFGQPTWAHFAMELKMARRPERVRDFYAELLPRIESPVRAQLDAMAERMRADGHDGPISAWDWRYYDEGMRRSDYGVDQNKVSEFFELDPTMQGMFDITGEVFGVEYRQVGETRAWHESVRLYEIVGPRLRAHDRALLRGPLPARRQVRPRRGVPAGARPAHARRRVRDAGERHRRELHAAVGRPAGAAHARGGADALPRVRPHPPHEPHERRVPALRRGGDRVGLRGGARRRSWSTGRGTHRSLIGSPAITRPVSRCLASSSTRWSVPAGSTWA